MTKRRMPRSNKNEGRGAVRFGLKSPINSSRDCPQAKIAFRGRKLARAAADRINGRNGRDAEWLRGQLGWKKRFFADVLADRECLGILEAIAIGRVLNRADLKLISAAVACQIWDEEEIEMAKERKR